MAEELKRRIEAALPGAEVQVDDLTGGGDHFRHRARRRFEQLGEIAAAGGVNATAVFAVVPLAVLWLATGPPPGRRTRPRGRASAFATG